MIRDSSVIIRARSTRETKRLLCPPSTNVPRPIPTRLHTLLPVHPFLLLYIIHILSVYPIYIYKYICVYIYYIFIYTCMCMCVCMYLCVYSCVFHKRSNPPLFALERIGPRERMKTTDEQTLAKKKKKKIEYIWLAFKLIPPCFFRSLSIWGYISSHKFF